MNSGAQLGKTEQEAHQGPMKPEVNSTISSKESQQRAPPPNGRRR
jgi:hypothetical protein